MSTETKTSSEEDSKPLTKKEPSFVRSVFDFLTCGCCGVASALRADHKSVEERTQLLQSELAKQQSQLEATREETEQCEERMKQLASDVARNTKHLIRQQKAIRGIRTQLSGQDTSSIGTGSAYQLVDIEEQSEVQEAGEKAKEPAKTGSKETKQGVLGKLNKVKGKVKTTVERSATLRSNSTAIQENDVIPINFTGTESDVEIIQKICQAVADLCPEGESLASKIAQHVQRAFPNQDWLTMVQNETDATEDKYSIPEIYFQLVSQISIDDWFISIFYPYNRAQTTDDGVHSGSVRMLYYELRNSSPAVHVRDLCETVAQKLPGNWFGVMGKEAALNRTYAGGNAKSLKLKFGTEAYKLWTTAAGKKKKR